MTSSRKKIPAATEAALWAISNGRCYAPGCPFPVVYEVRPGVYRKNAQVAHIYGVRGARHNEQMQATERDSFEHLILLCLPHHAEVDDPKTGAINYPASLLKKWKTDHEGTNGPVLATLGTFDEDQLTELLVDVFSPPIERLQAIADQLEETGTLNANSVDELRQIVDVLADTPAGPDAHTVSGLTYAAEVFSGIDLKGAASSLSNTADALDVKSLNQAAQSLNSSAEAIDIGALNKAAESLRHAAVMAMEAAEHM